VFWLAKAYVMHNNVIWRNNVWYAECCLSGRPGIPEVAGPCFERA